MISDVRKPVGLFAIVAAVAVLSAGCIAQDRPHEGGYLVVADAGANQVIAAGETAHFEWAENRTVKAEAGEPPHVQVEYAWIIGQQAQSLNHSYSLQSVDPRFVLIELNVTASETTASDAVGVLFAPDALDTSRTLYVAAVGPIEVRPGIPGASQFQLHTSGLHQGYSRNATLPAGTAPVRVSVDLLGSESAIDPIHGSLFFAVKDGPGAARGVATGPLEFDPANTYALWIDTTPAGHDVMEIRGADGGLISNTTLEAFEAAHAADEAVEVQVVEPQGGLPGFEGLAAIAAIVGVAAVLVAARRRS